MDPLTGRAVFSVVYYLPHDPAATATTTYLRISHVSLSQSNPASPTTSRVLEITPLHLLYVVSPKYQAQVLKNGDLRLPPAVARGHPPTDGYLIQLSAREVHVGDLLVVLTASTETASAAASIVTALSSVQRRGAVTLYTTTGSLFVDGVLCSSFADLYPPSLSALWPPLVAAADGVDGRCRPRDAVAMALFAPHRLLFTALPYPWTARLLQRLMDVAILPLVHRLWARYEPRSRCHATS